MCVTHNMAINLKGCTCIGVAELPLDDLWRSSRIEKKGRVRVAERVKAAPWES